MLVALVVFCRIIMCYEQPLLSWKSGMEFVRAQTSFTDVPVGIQHCLTAAEKFNLSKLQTEVERSLLRFELYQYLFSSYHQHWCIMHIKYTQVQAYKVYTSSFRGKMISVVAFIKLSTLIIELITGLCIAIFLLELTRAVRYCDNFRNSATEGRARVGSQCLLQMSFWYVMINTLLTHRQSVLLLSNGRMHV